MQKIVIFLQILTKKNIRITKQINLVTTVTASVV